MLSLTWNRKRHLAASTETRTVTPSWPVRAYILAVSVLGLIVLSQTLAYPPQDLTGLLVFLLLGGATQLLPIRFEKNASISMTMAVSLAAVLTFGVAAAVWVNLASGFVHYWKQIHHKKRPFYVSAVTTSTLMIAAWVAGRVYLAGGGIVGDGAPSILSLSALVVASLGYYLVNGVLITGAIALEQHSSFLELLAANCKWLTINIASLTPLAFSISFIYQRVGLNGLVLFLVPITLAWYSFRLYARSADDVRRANEELREANERVREINAEVSDANVCVQRANEELKDANERLNIMYEVSRSLVGSLYLDNTLERIVAATKLLGFEAGFIAGPIGERAPRILHWHANHHDYTQWVLTEPDRVLDTQLRKIIGSLGSQQWFASGETHVLDAQNTGAELSAREASSSTSFLPLTLIPLSIRGQAQWVVGVRSRATLSGIENKEIYIFRSMAENALETALAHEQAERDALSDSGTGLYNHRYFQEALQRELQEAAEQDYPLSFLMIDIDKFKQLNDMFGHLIGDQVLQIIAQIMKASIRETDIACRYGGDELCILLPHAGRPRAVEVASRIDQAIRAYPFRARQENSSVDAQLEEVRLRVSIGVATFPESSQTHAGLVEQADRACYRAKAAGGGVVASNEAG